MKRKEEMLAERNVTVSDVHDLLQLTMMRTYAASSDVREITKLAGVPPRMCREIERA